MVSWIIAGSVYIYCDLLVGGLTFAWGVGCHLLAKSFNDMGQDPNSEYFGQTFKILGICKLLAWSTQFVGHGIYERRAPALLTNIFFMYIGPFFVTYEYIAFFTGYRAEECKSYRGVIEADIAWYRQKMGFPQREGVEVIEDDKKSK